MPLVLDELGFRCTADYFDEPEDMTKIPEREVIREHKDYELRTVQTKSGGFGKIWKRKNPDSASNSEEGSRPGSRPGTATATPAASSPSVGSKKNFQEYDEYDDDDDLPPRLESPHPPPSRATSLASEAQNEVERSRNPEIDKVPSTAVHFDTEQILAELRESGIEVRELESSLPPLVASTQTQTAPASSNSSNQTQPHLSSSTTRPSLSQKASSKAIDPIEAPSFSRQLSERSQPSTPSPYEKSFAGPGYSYTEPSRIGGDDGGVSLSFASYDDEEIEIESKSKTDPNFSASSSMSPVSERYAAYGLSTETADQLAKEFSGRAGLDGGRSPSMSETVLPGSAPLSSPAITFLPVGNDGWSEDTLVSRGGLPGERRRGESGSEFMAGRPGLDRAPSQPPPTLTFGGLSNAGSDNPWG